VPPVAAARPRRKNSAAPNGEEISQEAAAKKPQRIRREEIGREKIEQDGGQKARKEDTTVAGICASAIRRSGALSIGGRGLV